MKSTYTNTECKKFKDLFDIFNTGFLITRASSDTLKGKPMSTTEVDNEGNLWFFKDEFSNKAPAVSHNNHVFPAYASLPSDSYMVITGKALVREDRQKMMALWGPVLKSWFPKGLDTPEIALSEVMSGEVEFDEGSSSKIIVHFKMLSAMIEGKSYAED